MVTYASHNLPILRPPLHFRKPFGLLIKSLTELFRGLGLIKSEQKCLYFLSPYLVCTCFLNTQSSCDNYLAVVDAIGTRAQHQYVRQKCAQAVWDHRGAKGRGCCPHAWVEVQPQWGSHGQTAETEIVKKGMLSFKVQEIGPKTLISHTIKGA